MRRRRSPTADRRPLAHRAPAVLDTRFHPGAFFDPTDVVQVKYEMLRRHRVEGGSVTDVAALYGVSRQTFYKIAQDFDAHGLVGLSPAKPRAKPGPRGPWKCTDEVVAYAARRRRARDAPSLVELTREVELRFGVRVSSGALGGALARLGGSPGSARHASQSAKGRPPDPTRRVARDPRPITNRGR